MTLNGSETVCYVFKTMSEAQFGELSLLPRIPAGCISAANFTTATGASPKKIGQIYTLNGKNREPVSVVNAGDIATVVKLRTRIPATRFAAPNIR